MRKVTNKFITIIAVVVMATAVWAVGNALRYTEPKSMFYMGKHYCPQCKTGLEIGVDMRTVSKCPTCGYRF